MKDKPARYTYDPETSDAGAFYVYFQYSPKKVHHTKVFDHSFVAIDYDENNEMIGIEILPYI